MFMKFLHTADLHFGATPDANRPWGKERAQAIRDSFARVISVCKSEDIDCLIISGGLFDGHPTTKEVEEINDGFASIPNTRVYAIAGEDDLVFANSPAVNYKWAPNVTYVRDVAFNKTAFDELNFEIVGASNNKQKFDIDRLSNAKPTVGKASILVLCASELEEAEIPKGFTYVALGGSHKPLVMREGRVVNAGAPEPVDSKDTGKHGYYIGEIDTKENKLKALKFVSIQNIKYITLVVNITPVSKNEDVLNSLRSEITRRGTENIYTIKVRGLCNPEETFDLEELKYEFRVDEIYDLTEPKYDFVQLFKDHSSDMIGFFVKEMNSENKSDMERKALNYGVNALLKTKDERN